MRPSHDRLLPTCSSDYIEQMSFENESAIFSPLEIKRRVVDFIQILKLYNTGTLCSDNRVMKEITQQ